MYLRHLQTKIVEALEFMPIVLVRGARQTGKTTLVKSICAGKEKTHRYLSFDHLPSLVAAREDPVGFISGLEKPIILDEIQRVPELFLPIKNDVDENRTPGRYLLTGSADPLLIPKLGDSLAGRMRLLNLWPLSQGEINGKKEFFIDRLFENGHLQHGTADCSKEILLALAMRGGYPTACALKSEKHRNEWFNDYVSLVLQKDVLDLSRIENLSQMPHLLMLLASRVGGLLNVEELARSTKLSSVTLHRYLGLLKTLFFTCLLPAWHGNIGKRLIKSPKIYLNDTALQLFLLNIDAQKLQSSPQHLGSIIENFVILEILKQLSWSEKHVQIYHYRDYSNSEVDIILEGPGGGLVAIEIKSSETITSSDFKGLRAFQLAAKEKFIQGILLYAGNASLPFGPQLSAMPITTLWDA